MSALIRTALIATSCAALLTFAPAFAQDSLDPDTREVNSYALTESGMDKFAQALVNLGETAGQPGGACDNSADDGDEGGNDQSLDGQAARINRNPAAAAAIVSAGMPVREFVVFTWSMIQNGIAAWTQTQPGVELPPGVSIANVDFYRAHEAEMQRLAQQAQAVDCQSDADYTEDVYIEDDGYPGEQDYQGEDSSEGEED